MEAKPQREQFQSVLLQAFMENYVQLKAFTVSTIEVQTWDDSWPT